MRIALLLLAAAVPAFAGPIRVKSGPKSEEKLRKFVAQDAKLKARLDDAVKREAVFVAEARESDLRDAVSDTAITDLHTALEKSTGEKRKAVLESLPGMRAVAGPACATLADCPALLMSMDVADARELPDAIRLLVRPWMALAGARGTDAEIAAIDGPGDAALSVSLKGVKTQLLLVSPHLLGGFTVWYDQPQVAAAIYATERAAVLKTAP